LKILVIDSVANELFIALIRNDAVTIKIFASPRQHDRNINCLVREVLSTGKTVFLELDAIAVVTGPGSWTGSRVGVSAAKAYSMALGKPAINITAQETRDKLIDSVRDAFNNKKFVAARELAPQYNSEFKVTLSKK